MGRIPPHIECPSCGETAQRHCDPKLYPGARCFVYCCEAPRKGMSHLKGCGIWTEIRWKPSVPGFGRWVIKRQAAIGVPPSSS